MAEYQRLDFRNVKEKTKNWLRDTMNLLPRHEHPNGLTAVAFTSRRDITRDVMADRLLKVLQIVNTQSELISHLENEALKLKSDIIEKQETVITLQNELISAKDDQLSALKDTVVTTVGDTVQTQLKSYSQAVQGQATSNIEVINPKVVKSVVKDVVAEEDRSRNVVIFGIEENSDVEICDKVGQIFEVMGEKPKFDATRIGLNVNERSPRPVKVSMSNQGIVMQILSKARMLRGSESFKNVFLSPDRSKEEQAAHRELVKLLKAKRNEQPGKRFYIKGQEILCNDKKTD